MVSSKIHFIEANIVIYFPNSGNEGRNYEKYGIAYRDRKTGKTQPGVRINLEDVLNMEIINEKYPHTIGLYIDSRGRGKSFRPEYIKKVIINKKGELFNFLSINKL